MFLDGGRDPDKKRVIALVEDDFVDELADTTVLIQRGCLRSETLISHLRRGAVPVVLISLAIGRSWLVWRRPEGNQLRRFRHGSQRQSEHRCRHGGRSTGR